VEGDLRKEIKMNIRRPDWNFRLPRHSSPRNLPVTASARTPTARTRKVHASAVAGKKQSRAKG